MGIRNFYRIGEAFDTIFGLDEGDGFDVDDFPYASNETPLFISSAYGLPYPIAAIKEYLLIMKKVCRNDQKRIAYFLKNRTPASSQKEVFNSLNISFRKRCHKIIPIN